MSAYPLFLLLEGRRVLVVGGGPVALEKARELARHGARVRVAAPEVHPELRAIADEVLVEPFAPRHLEGAFLVLAAAPPDVNEGVRGAAERRAIFVVAVDDVARCSAFGAAHFTRGGVTVALSSSGRAPALVALLRRAIEAVLPDDVEAWRRVAEHARAEWKRDGTPIRARRRLLLDALNAMYRDAEVT